MGKNKFFIRWTGNKFEESRHALPALAPIIPQIKTVVEPYCGSFGFSRYLCDKNIIGGDVRFVFNDANKLLIDLYEAFKRDETRARLIEQYNERIIKPLTEIQEFVKIKHTPDMPIFDYFFSIRTKRRYMFDDRIKDRLYDINDANHDAARQPFHSARFSNRPAIDVMREFQCQPDALLYCDPPYMNSFNLSYFDLTHKLGDNTAEIVHIARMINSPDTLCKMMIIVERNALMEYIFGDKIKFDYQKTYGISGKRTRHVVITNF